MTGIQGKVETVTTRLKIESKAETEWILEAETTGLKLKDNAVERYWIYILTLFYT